MFVTDFKMQIHLNCEGGPQPAVLQEVNIPIWSNNDCRLKYGPAAPGGIVEHMVCAGQASKDSCSVSVPHYNINKLINLNLFICAGRQWRPFNDK